MNTYKRIKIRKSKTDKLTEAQRELISVAHLIGLTYAQIGRAFTVAPASAKYWCNEEFKTHIKNRSSDYYYHVLKRY